MKLDFAGEVVAGIAVGGIGVEVASIGVGEIWAGVAQAVRITTNSVIKVKRGTQFIVIFLTVKADWASARYVVQSYKILRRLCVLKIQARPD
jgi:hypothetical protein